MAALQVDPESSLTGYTFTAVNKGRHVTFFWQNATNGHSVDHGHVSDTDNNPIRGGIYSSTFYKHDPTTWKPSGKHTLVATNAKKETPLAAVSWSNGSRARVYYLNERNHIFERMTTNGGQTWSSGPLSNLFIPTRSNSSLGAVVSWESPENFEIHVYFQDEHNRIRDFRYRGEEGHWCEDYPENWKVVTGVCGTSLAVASESTHGVKRWVFTQTAERWAEQFCYEKKGHKWITPVDRNHFSQYFEPNSTGIRLGYSADPWHLRIFAHDGHQVAEHTWKRGKDCHWLDETVLPTSKGTAKIFQNFIVLNWPLDKATKSEVHLFSMKDGILWDYVVGSAKKIVVPLVKH